jgi:cell division septal protein FtsQ
MAAIGGARRLTHAEQVRQRRIREAERQQEEQRQQNYRVLRPQTVVARSNAQARPLYHSNGMRARKAHYFQMKASGGEIRVRSLPSARLSWRAFSGAVSLVIFILILYLVISPTFKISKVSMNGLQRLSPLEVESSLPIGNTPIFTLDPNKLVSSLSATYPELANIRVKLTLPATLSITATERVPIISWVTSDRTYWIDLEGNVFPARGEATPPLTILSNAIPPAPAEQSNGEGSFVQQLLPVRAIEPSVLNAILDLSNRMPQETTFLYSQQDGLGWNDPRGWEVFIGLDLSNLTVKITEYEAIISQLDQKGIHPRMISVEHIDAPFFRTE